jgi:sec-independent protein translocase protein TatC
MKESKRFEEKRAVFTHLTELRWRIIAVVVSIILVTILLYRDTYLLVDYLSQPIKEFNITLAFFTMIGAFMTRLKLAFIAGLIILSPFLLYQTLAFIAPGLRRKEKKILYLLIVIFALPLILGAAFSFYFVFPVVMKYMIRYGSAYMVPIFNAEAYFSFAGLFCLASGLVFIVPTMVIILGKLGIVKYEGLKRLRKFMITAIILGEMVLIPAMDISMFLVVGLPIYILFELSALVVRIMEKRKVRIANVS